GGATLVRADLDRRDDLCTTKPIGVRFLGGGGNCSFPRYSRAELTARHHLTRHLRPCWGLVTLLNQHRSQNHDLAALVLRWKGRCCRHRRPESTPQNTIRAVNRYRAF